MEREARKVQEKECTGTRRKKLLEEKQYASNSKEQLCLRDATRIWKIHTTKRACATECNLNINLYDKLGGEGGSPQGGPQLG